MVNRWKSGLWGAAVTALLLSGCAQLQQLIQKPTMEYDRFTLEAVSLEGATVRFFFKVTNPNPLGLPVRRLVYNLVIDGKSLFKGVLDEGVSLRPQSTTTLEVPVSVTFQEMFQSVQTFLNSDEVPFTLSGSVSAGPVTLPYRHSGKIPIPRLPRVTLKSVQVKKLSLSGASITLNVGVKNRNAFDIDLGKLDYALTLAGHPVAKGAMGAIQNLKQNQDAAITLPIQLSFSELGMALFSVLKKSSLSYELNGNFLTGSGENQRLLPLKSTGSVKIQK